MALKEICGLWLGKTKDGKGKMSGMCKEAVTIPEGIRLMVLKNESDHPKAPQYRLFAQIPDSEVDQPDPEPEIDDNVPF